MVASQVEWLASVLAARGYPLERLARNLELAAAVLAERLPAQRVELDAMFARAARPIQPA